MKINLVRIIMYVVIMTTLVISAVHYQLIERIGTGAFISGLITLAVVGLVLIISVREKQRRQWMARHTRALSGHQFRDSE